MHASVLLGSRKSSTTHLGPAEQGELSGKRGEPGKIYLQTLPLFSLRSGDSIGRTSRKAKASVETLSCFLLSGRKIKDWDSTDGILSTSISKAGQRQQVCWDCAHLPRWPGGYHNEHSGRKRALSFAFAHHVGTSGPDVRSADQQKLSDQATTKACSIRPFQRTRHGGQQRRSGQKGRQDSHQRQPRELCGVRVLQCGKRKPTVECIGLIPERTFCKAC